jgi:kanamycin kinase
VTVPSEPVPVPEVVADRWADIAVAMLSLSWNYGVDADPARIEAYQRLWNAGDISSH